MPAGFRRSLLAWGLLGTLASCAPPMPVTEDSVLAQLADNYDDFFGEQQKGAAHADVIRPRFGLPAMARSEGAFEVEALARGGATDPKLALVSPGAAATCAGPYALELTE